MGMNRLLILWWILSTNTASAEPIPGVPLSIDGFLQAPLAQVPEVLSRADNLDLVRNWVDAAISAQRMDLLEVIVKRGAVAGYTIDSVLALPPSDFKVEFIVMWFRLGTPVWLDDPEVMALMEGIKGSYSPEAALPIIKGVNEILPEREVTHDEIQHRAARLKIADEMEAALLQRKTARTTGEASPDQSAPTPASTQSSVVGRAGSVPEDPVLPDADHSTAWWLAGIAALALLFGIGVLRKARQSQPRDG
jgi:hypothetical protein